MLLELTEEERKTHLDPVNSALNNYLQLSPYTHAFTRVYMTLTMGYFYRMGETPKLIHDIAQVWATGVADLYL